MNPVSQPRVVIKTNAKRDAVITIVSVVLLLGVLAFAITQLGEKPQGNALTGEIVGKEFTPFKEEIVEFSGRRLKATRKSDGEYVFKVRVDSEGGRVFDVPVSKAVYVSKKEGNSMKFIRPKSEQQ